ncbi:Uncharacterised protein [Providencia heimbachae]|uniref:Transposase n=1 Tax=Providencia heimbachae ATCC 35613 TaxID=1354272 RepID=A0A1B7JJB7_9GAMM|nr:transposase [Providencia heimbachae ATCC 35613]SQH12659.1 Uncharacterised protein [Providencia heimbachae]
MVFESRGKPTNILFHSGQGSHYTSRVYRQLLWRYQINQSLSREVIVGIMRQWNVF